MKEVKRPDVDGSPGQIDAGRGRGTYTHGENYR
jgi:hypothetical protein